jgi:probable addiction module antidote protein
MAHQGKDKQYMASTRDFDDFLTEWLKEPEHAATFLNAALEDANRDFFLTALRSVARAWGGLSLLADVSDISKTTMYRALSRQGNPDFRKISTILENMGLRLTVEPVATP